LPISTVVHFPIGCRNACAADVTRRREKIDLVMVEDCDLVE
jgi:hypothetical protein